VTTVEGCIAWQPASPPTITPKIVTLIRVGAGPRFLVCVNRAISGSSVGDRRILLEWGKSGHPVFGLPVSERAGSSPGGFLRVPTPIRETDVPELIRERRCLIPVNCYYEWKRKANSQDALLHPQNPGSPASNQSV